MRGLILATQFLTRIPTPQLREFKPEWLAQSARWFAVVGLIVGTSLLACLLLGQQLDPWLAALLALACWVLITGGLHLDGLADLSDALGAAHRASDRFFAVLKDPHLGSFGVIALVMALLAKLVLLMLLARQHEIVWGLLLVPAWARWFAVLWSATLKPLSLGSGEQFAWQRHWPSLIGNALLLCGLSAWLAPVLLLAPVAGLAWWGYLKRRLGGMTGDCLGAGVELCEIALLGLLLVRL